MTKNQESIVDNAVYDRNSPIYAGCGCLVLLMLCIGIITVIALLFWSDRSSLAQARHKKQLQARSYLYSMNKIQQAYFAEKSVFSTSIKEVGIKTETENYKYFIFSTKIAVFNYGVSKQKDVKSYVGGVFVIPAAKQVDLNSYNMTMTTTSILCIADSPGTIKPPEPTNQNGKIACGTGTTEVTR
ncbi:MAG: type IV pilin-like G/H family protein [Tychonema bourrellyi B0820]|uniref:General secretion pathway protein GspH n=1 Tax=Tychonema bourrellyi FEM_GT703 TaxID=2040638 RepID=A0A2G4EZZ3_9CYAN|nr:type IV pilin-like G/H family protein [Tychonema bourrellyi]MDQ2099651.1 type IV pilin-like G/H family protein [Tychonema bourrellyi B0820]PHX55075.1 general secretion pathway protein GspH [Tychonema bourrellyi FEM_GT703]